MVVRTYPGGGKPTKHKQTNFVKQDIRRTINRFRQIPLALDLQKSNPIVRTYLRTPPTCIVQSVLRIHLVHLPNFSNPPKRSMLNAGKQKRKPNQKTTSRTPRFVVIYHHHAGFPGPPCLPPCAAIAKEEKENNERPSIIYIKIIHTMVRATHVRL